MNSLSAPFAVLDFAGLDLQQSNRRVFREPLEILQAESLAQVVPVLERVDQATRRDGLYAVGYVAYEAAPAFDSAHSVHPHSQLPLVCFGLFDRYELQLEAPSFPPSARATDWQLELSRREYDAAIARIREEIAAGGVYQVNFTTRLRAQFSGDARMWYEELRRAQGPGYHALLHFGGNTVLSISPELFFTRRGQELVTRPMKGTRPRGRWHDEDMAIAAELAASEKDRAELLMIVDLVRNDLGRIAAFDTVQVKRIYELERYRTVWQTTATVQAQLRRDIGLARIFGAIFPCGSVTGAPKIAAMKMIRELERSPREVYCGALGVVEPGGDCTFNVPIRTAWIDPAATAEYGVGSGVTWESAAQSEYDELRAKSVVITQPWSEFELLETMRIQDGVIIRRGLHLERLSFSAAYFDFAMPRDVLDLLQQVADAHTAGSWRLRVLLNERGVLRTDAWPLEARPAGIQLVAISENTVRSTDRFLYHKTTNRILYERAASARPDCFDVLLCNERGEITEFTRGNLVVQIGGDMVTPALSSGLLPGVFRRMLLMGSEISERVLHPDDLGRAQRMWFINSLREWIEVKLVP